MIVVDVQGGGSSEESVPREEKIELLRALRPDGPHVVLIEIPLLDFTEAEKRAVERRMEILTFAVLETHNGFVHLWRLAEETWAQRAGAHPVRRPAVNRLMDKCRYRQQVLDNK